MNIKRQQALRELKDAAAQLRNLPVRRVGDGPTARRDDLMEVARAVSKVANAVITLEEERDTAGV